MAPLLHATGKTGSWDEPGTSPFILANLQQTCHVSESFMFMTPTSPCLALSSSSSSNSHLPSKALMSLCSLKRTHYQRTSQEVQSPQSQHHILFSPMSLAQQRKAGLLLCWLTHGYASPSHDLMLVFSHIRQECVLLSTKSVGSICGIRVLNKTTQECCTFLSTAVNLTFPFQVIVQILSEVDKCLWPQQVRNSLRNELKRTAFPFKTLVRSWSVEG